MADTVRDLSSVGLPWPKRAVLGRARGSECVLTVLLGRGCVSVGLMAPMKRARASLATEASLMRDGGGDSGDGGDGDGDSDSGGDGNSGSGGGSGLCL